jgi:hypothetical protein
MMGIIHITDLPFIAIVAIGIFLPEIYIKFKWSAGLLATIRLITLFAVCTIAMLVNQTFYQNTDNGVIFTRAFVFICFSRLVLYTSQQITEKKQEQEKQNSTNTRIQEKE